MMPLNIKKLVRVVGGIVGFMASALATAAQAPNLPCEPGTARYFTLVKDFETASIQSETRHYLPVWGDESEVEVRNAKGQRLRFRLTAEDRLGGYHGGIAFILYEFDPERTYHSEGYNAAGPKPYLVRITTYGQDGVIKGEGEFDDIAVTEFVIRDERALERKLQRIDREDGNLDVPDQAERLVTQKFYDSQRKLIRAAPIASSEFWNYQHLIYRP